MSKIVIRAAVAEVSESSLAGALKRRGCKNIFCLGRDNEIHVAFDGTKYGRVDTYKGKLLLRIGDNRLSISADASLKEIFSHLASLGENDDEQ